MSGLTEAERAAVQSVADGTGGLFPPIMAKAVLEHDRRACRAYHLAANLACGLTRSHDGPHAAAAIHGEQMRRFTFAQTDGRLGGTEYPR